MFSGFFYCYFKGISLLKNRELTLLSLNWTIIDVLGPEFDSWVPPWSYFGDGYITSQLIDWTAWLILCGHEMWRCVEEISWLCIIDTRWMFNTSIVHCTQHDRPVLCSVPRQPFSSQGVGYQLGTNSDHLQFICKVKAFEKKINLCFRGWGKSQQINLLQDLTAWRHKTAILSAILLLFF